MSNPITISQNEFHELVEQLRRIENLLTRLVKTQEEHATHRARRDLVAFLDDVHKQLPDVPVEEAERDILEAIQAVRKGE